MEEFKIEDFIPVYPLQDDAFIQELITRKREFNELKTASIEKPKEGEFYRHQKIFTRYMRNYDRLMLVNSVGTGKSSAIISLAEYYRNNNQNIKKIYVLEKSDTTKSEFYSEIKRVVKNFSTRQIGEWYFVKTYSDFIKYDIKDKDDKELIDEFSRCIIVIDEAHNLRNFKEKIKDKEDEIITEEQFDKLKKLFRIINGSKIIISTATPMINGTEELGKLFNLLVDKDVEDQYYEKWGEILDYSNFDEDKLRPFYEGKVSYIRALDIGILINNVGEKMGKFNINDEIYFSDNVLTTLCMVEDGCQNKKNIEFSRDIKQHYFNKEENTLSSIVIPSQNNTGILNLKSCFLSSGSNKYEINNQIEVINSKGVKIKLSSYIRDFEELKKSSIKFAFIIKNELNYLHKINSPYLKGILNNIKNFNISNFDKDEFHWDYQQKDLPAEKGNAFIYTGELASDGAIPLGLCFEQYGFKRFISSSSKDEAIFNPDGTPIIPKGLRYGLFVKNLDQNTKNMIDIFKCPANKHGEYIQLIIASKIARDGINLPNVTRGYLFLPSWNEATMHQAMSRFIRSTSHLQLTEGRENKVRVDIFKLCAYNSNILNINSLSSKEDVRKCSVDKYTYNLAERKDIETKKMMRFIKRIAFDCILHYDRNVRKDDCPYSKECDYMPDCDYKCFEFNKFKRKDALADGYGPTKEEYDYSTYNILYLEEKKEEYSKKILDYIKKNGYGIVNTFIEKFKEDEEMDIKNVKIYIYEAINKLVKERTSFRDNFGFEKFITISENGEYLYSLNSNLNKSSKLNNFIEIGIYRNQLGCQYKKTLNEIFESSRKEAKIEDKNIDNNLSEEEFYNLIFSSSLNEIVKLVEETIKKVYINNENKTKLDEYILNYYYPYIFKTKTYKKIFIRIENELAGDRRGAPPKDISKRKFTTTQEERLKKALNKDIYNDYTDDEKEEEEITYVHNIDLKNSGEINSYTEVLKYRESQYNGRIYDKDIEDFRDFKPIEMHVYPYIIYETYIYRNRNKIIIDNKYVNFGINFYSVSKKNYETNIANYEPIYKKDGKIDYAKIKKGALCDNKGISSIIEYFIEEENLIKDGEDLSEELINKEDSFEKEVNILKKSLSSLFDKIKSKGSLDTLLLTYKNDKEKLYFNMRRIYNWVISYGDKRTKYCSEYINYLKKNDRIIYYPRICENI